MAGVDTPVMGAPMTFISGFQLASAVSNAGGLGMIETTTPQGRASLVRVRDYTDRPVAANISLIVKRELDFVDELTAKGIRFVTTSAGDPGLFTDRLRAAGIVVFHVVGTLAAARKALDAGVDGLVVEGVEGGGFKNRYGASTMVLLPLVAANCDVPIVAAGGICDARSMAAAFVLGAHAVQMGTRLLSSAESPVHDNFKQAIVKARETSTVLLPLRGAAMMRVIRTEFAEQIETEPQPGAGPKALQTVQELYFGGDLQRSLANTGQVAGRIDAVQPVSEILHDMWFGCRQILADTALATGIAQYSTSWSAAASTVSTAQGTAGPLSTRRR